MMNNNNIRPEWIPSAYREEKMGDINKTFSLNTCKDILFGVAIGDALGVPMESNGYYPVARIAVGIAKAIQLLKIIDINAGFFFQLTLNGLLQRFGIAN